MASKHSNRRSLLYAGSMEYLGRTTGRQRHGVGKGGGGGAGTGGGQIRGTGGTGTNRTGNGQGITVGKAGESGEGEGAGKKKNRWWGHLRRNRGSTEEEVPIKFGTYNLRNGRNGVLEAALRGMYQANMELGVL